MQYLKYWDKERLLLDTYWRSPPCFLASRSRVKRVVSRRREGRKQADLRSQLEDGWHWWWWLVYQILQELKWVNESDLEPIFEAVFRRGGCGGRE